MRTALFSKFIPPFAGSPSTLLNGLLMYWSLDDTLAEIINGYNLTIGGTATYAAGKHNNGGSFPTNTARFFTAAAPSLCQATPNDGASFACWAFRDTNAPANARVLSHISATPAFNMRSANGITYNAAIANEFITINVSPGGDITDGQWHLLVLVFNRNHDRIVRAYLPDQSLSSISGAGASEKMFATASSLLTNIGMGSTAVANPWGAAGATSLIDEVMVWNRAISDAEITELFNLGAGKFYPF